MARTSKIHYIAPSSVSIVPNANGSPNDLAVSVGEGTRIKVYSEGIGELGTDPVTNAYREWTLSGLNRRLADSDSPYTIYARLPKNDTTAGYLVFARQEADGDGFIDKYPYVTASGLADGTAGADTGDCWYVRMGYVTLPENGKREVVFDSGLLGTVQYNEEWKPMPDELPLRVQLGCTIDDEDAGPKPYVLWNKALVLTAALMEGWTAADAKRIDHWEITRNTDDAAADAAWNGADGDSSSGQPAGRVMPDGAITLTHSRDSAVDDFNGAVSTLFTVTAWGWQDDAGSSSSSSSGSTLVALASESINIMAETVEKYELELSTSIVRYNPPTDTYYPEDGITIRIRAIDQSGTVFKMTREQFVAARLLVQYVMGESGSWVTLPLSDRPSDVAEIIIPIVAFHAQQNMNVRIVRVADSDSSGSTGDILLAEMTRQTIAFVRDGEDSKDREWIYFRSEGAVTFGDDPEKGPLLPSLITKGEVNPEGAARPLVDYDNVLDGWVPEGWTDEPQGTDDTMHYEYGAYRDFIRGGSGDSSSSSSGGQAGGYWGDFSKPAVWSYFAEDAVSYRCRWTLDGTEVWQLTAAYTGAFRGTLPLVAALMKRKGGSPEEPVTADNTVITVVCEGIAGATYTFNTGNPRLVISEDSADPDILAIIAHLNDAALTGLTVTFSIQGAGEEYSYNIPVIREADEESIKETMEEVGSELFLSKTADDAAAGEIGFLKGLWIKAKGLFGFDADGNVKANDVDAAGNMSVGDKLDVYGVETVNDLKSRSYSGPGLADTGWSITNDNGSGSSQAVFDYLTIRKKMIINSIEIKETHFSAGDVAHTLAEAEIARTDFLYIDQNGNEELLGYSQVKVPWLLRGIALVLGKRNGGVDGVFSHFKKVRLTVTDAEIKRCNRIRCYFLSKDGDHEIENWFRPDDLVRCQTWNVVKEHRDTFTPDFDDHTGNVYWWRKIKDVSYNTGVPRYIAKDAQGNPTNGTTTNVNQAYVNEGGIPRLATNGTCAQNVDDKHSQKVIDGNTYHWFDVEYDYYAEQRGATGSADAYSDIPAAGDKVVQFGNTTDPDRMNIYLVEVNGAGNPDAPDWKMYRGVYTFSLQNCWWGGESCCKTKWSVSTGIEAYAPQFKWITEYGMTRQVFTRQEVYWNEIALERDDYTNERSISSYPDYSDDIVDNNGNFVSRGGFKIVNGRKVYGSAQNPIPKNWVRKCRYYEQVTHQGSVWLCSMVESFYWRDANGNHIPSRREGAEYVRSYTTQEPTSAANDWTEQVEKGDEGAFKSSVFCRTNKDISAYQPQGGTYDNPIPTSTRNAQGIVDSSIVWTDGIPDGDAMLWETTAWFYSNADPAPWTPPRKQTDNETIDIEFSPNSIQPSDPVGTAANKDTAAIKTQRHNQGGENMGWFDPNDALTGWTWSDMVWRAERKIKNGEYYGSWAVSRIKGENSVRIDLTNENDSMLYTSGGTLVSGNVTSEAKLYDGSEDVSTKATWTMTAVGCTLSSGNSRSIVVKGMTAATGYVNVQAVYTDKNGTAYTKVTRLTLKKLVDVDKYDLEITPNSIAYNSTKDSPATSTLSIKVWKSTVDGSRVVSDPPSGYGVYVNGDKQTKTATGTFSFTTDNSEYDTVLVKIAKTTDLNDILDSENIPITKAEDGKNVVRMDLDNEYDSIQYQGDGKTKVSSSASVKTTCYLFDGITDKSADVTFSVDTANTTLKSSSYSLVGRVLTVSSCQLTDSSYGDGYVTLKCTYKETAYRTKFSVGYLLNTDKFDLDVNPNALFLNTSEGWSASKTITVKVMRTPAGGGEPTAVNPSTYGLVLAASVGSLSSYDTSTKAFTLTVTQAQATSNNDATISLYKNGDNTKVYDRETVPFNRAENGTSPYFADIDNEMDSVACDKNGNTLTDYDTTIGVGLWYGSTPIDITTLTASEIEGFTITPNKTAKTIRIQVAQGTNIAEVNTVNITVAGSGSGNKSLHFVLNGVRQGENGEPAILYTLVPSVSAVVKKKNGTYNVDNVSCTRQKNVGGTITDNTTDGSITYKLDGGSEQSYTNNTNIAVSGFTKSIQFIFKVNSKVVDIETIPMVADGTDGVTPTVTIDPTSKNWIINGVDTGVKAEGTDGTGVEIKGTVASPSKLTIRNGKGYAIPMNSQGGDDPEVEAKHGDCYICNSNRHLYMFTSKPTVAWNDLGEFQGAPGDNSYMHIAYATGNPLNVTTSTVDNIGFTVNNDGGQYEWMGFCTDNNPTDPGRNWSSLTPAQKVAVVNTYKWNYMKGKDGSGVEYIYLLTKEDFKPTINPNSYTDPSTGQIAEHGDPTKDEFYPKVGNYQAGKIYGNSQYWEDDPPADVSETWPVLWWASRKFRNGAWEPFGDVSMHNRYTKDGVTPTVVIDPNTKNWIINGEDTGVKAEGTDGTGVEIKGTVASPSKLTIRNGKGYAIPMNSQGGDDPEVEAKHGDCYICDSNRHLYMFTSTPSVAWNDLGEFQGAPGDNSYMHIAYATGNPLNVTTSTVDNIGFTVNNDGGQYEWMGFCTDNNPADPGRNWSSLTPAQKVAVVNTYKWNYMKGKDGSGYEYIYLITKEDFKPTINPNSYTDPSTGQIAEHGDPTKDEFYPKVGNYQAGKIYGNSQYWEDDPPADVSETWPVLWWASRKKSDDVWQAFGSVALHNRYAKDGTSPWISDLDNEMDSIACDNDNHPVKQQAVSTNVSMFYGSQKKAFITSVNGYSNNVPSGGITVTWGNTSAATADDSDTVTITFATTATIDGNKEFEITLTAKDDSTIIRKLTLTVNGLKGGATYNLVPSASSISLNKSGQYSTNSLTCSYNKFDVAKGSFVTPADGTIKYVKDGDTAEYGYKALVPGTDFTSSVTFLLYVGSTLVDRETVNIVRDGLDGNNSVKIDLDNEYDSILYDGTGTTKMSGNVTTKAYLFDGITDVSANATFIISNREGVTDQQATISGRDVTVSGVTSDAIVTIRAEYPKNSGKYYYAKFTVKKLLGIDKYDLVVTPNAIGVNTSNTVADQPITVKVKRTPGNGGDPGYVTFTNKTVNDYGLTLEVSDSRGNTLTETTGTAATTERTFNLTGSMAASVDNVTVLLKKGTSNVVQDVETIPVNQVHNGIDGSGSNAVKIDLDNEMDSIPCDSEGVVMSQTVLSTGARIYDGASPVTSGVTIKSVQQIAGVTAVTSVTAGVASVSWTIAKNTNLSVDKFTAQIVLTWNSHDYYGTFTANVVKSGQPGVSPTIYQLSPNPSDIAFSRDSSGNLPTSPKTLEMKIKKTLENNTELVTIAASGLTVRYRKDQMPDSITDGTEFPASGLDVYATDNNIYIAAFSGTTLVDREVVPVVKDGVNGTSPWIADLDNEMDSVACEYGTGKVAIEREVETNLSMYYGSTKKSFKITSVKRNGTALTSGTALNGVTATFPSDASTARTVKVKYATTAIINDKDDIAITLQPVDATSETRVLHFTINGIRPGKEGDSAVLYSLQPSDSQIAVKKNGTRVPSGNVTCSVVKTDGKSSPVTVTTGFTLKTFVDGTEKTSSTVSSSSVNTSIVYELYIGTTLVDRETIPVVADGNDGSNVSTLDIDNEYDMVQTTSSGVVNGAQTKSTIVRLYDGSTEVDISAATISTSGGPVVTGDNKVATFSQGAEANNGKGRVLSWAFIDGKTISDTYEITISYTYKSIVFKATFTISASKGQAVLQLKPSHSALSCAVNASNTWDNPPALSLKIVKLDSNSTSESNATNDNLSSLGVVVRYAKGANATMPATKAGGDAWPNGNSVQAIPSDGNVYIAMFNNAGVLLDRETIPVVKDGIKGNNGKNSIRLALDNEHEDFLYNAAGTLVAPAGGATSQARMYDGPAPVSADAVTWTVDLDRSSGVPKTGGNIPTCVAGLLTVPHITGDTAKVVVKATYPISNGSVYYAEFTANKTEGDKYDIIVRPNAISYNAASYSQQTVTISAKGINAQGGDLGTITISSGTPAAGKFYVFWGYVSANGTVGALSNLGGSTKDVTAAECADYAGIYFELRRYSDASNYRLCDYETVEITKVVNGQAGQSVYTATAFKRSTTKPAATGGNYSTGKPSESGWADGIPSGTDPVWMAQRVLTDDGQSPQQSTWTVSLMKDIDGELDVEFSPCTDKPVNPTDSNRSQGRYSGDKDHIDTSTYKWFDPTLDANTVNWEKMIWMATRNRIINSSGNPDWGSWAVVKVKGESGGQTQSKESWFRAEQTRPSTPPALVIGQDGNPTNYYLNQDTSWSESKKYLYVAERYFLTDGTYFWDGPKFSSEWAEQGPAGKDGYTVTCEPASLVINQNDGGTYDISTNSPAYFKPKVTKGNGTTNLVSAVSVSQNYCVKSSSTNIVVAGAWTSANGLPITGVASAAISNKYTQGYLVLSVTADSKTFTINIPIAVNYLGTYISTIVDGKKTEIAGMVVTEITEDGTFVVNDQSYEQVKTAAQASEQWISTVNTPAATVANYNTRISNAEGNINTVTKKVNDGKNLLSGVLTGAEWMCAASSNYTRHAMTKIQDEWFYVNSGDAYIVSPSVSVVAGKYTLSFDTPYSPSTNVNVQIRKASNVSVLVASSAATSTSGTRKSATFTFTSEDSVYVYIASERIRHPQLETGTSATQFEAPSYEVSSQIKQTADGLQTQVNSKASTSALEQTASSILTTVSSKTQTNLFDCSDGEGWREWSNDSLCEYDSSTQKVISSDCYSTAVSLKAGVTYVLSFYCNTLPSVMPCECFGDPNADTANMGTLDEIEVTQMSETYLGKSRYKCLFTPSESGYYKFDVYDDGMALIYRPQIEVGNTPTAWVPGGTNQTSFIKQTADEVNIGIRNGLNNTGINITSGTIKLQANKVTFSDSRGTNTDKISIDPATGTLRAVDGIFEGSMFYHKVVTVDISGSQYTSTYDASVYVEGQKPKMYGDIFILMGNKINARYAVVLPPTNAALKGLKLKIIRGFHSNPTQNIWIEASGDMITIERGTDTPIYNVNGIFDPDDGLFYQNYEFNGYSWIELVVGNAFSYNNVNYYQWIIIGKG